MASSSEKLRISLTLVVDKEKNKVLYAEAESDFVEILVSFLTLPLGTISTLVSKHSSSVEACTFNCITSLRQSVENMDPKYFQSDYTKAKLLNPTNPMEADCENPLYYLAESQTSKSLRGFLMKPHEHLIVSDDLTLMPWNLNTTLWIHRNLRTYYVPQRLTVTVTHHKVVDLLKLSLWSNTPLTDLFLKKKLNIIQNCKILPTQSHLKMSKQLKGARKSLKLKVMISKSERKILVAEAEEDFTDQILSFLTIPLGVVEHLVQGNLGFCCIDNLYKSLSNLDASNYLNFDDLMNKLLNPDVESKTRYQKLPVYRTPRPSEIPDATFGGPSLSRPRSSVTRSMKNCGYVSGRLFMVGDDLCVEPFFPEAALSFLRGSHVQLVEQDDDIEIRDLSIGADEVLEILKASMMTSSALTTSLGSFLVKKEKF